MPFPAESSLVEVDSKASMLSPSSPRDAGHIVPTSRGPSSREDESLPPYASHAPSDL